MALIRITGQTAVACQEWACLNEHSRPQARDGISRFIDYYNNRGPHQRIVFMTPYDKLTGQEERIFKERRARAMAAQEIRKIDNRRKIDIATNKEMTPVKKS